MAREWPDDSYDGSPDMLLALAVVVLVVVLAALAFVCFFYWFIGTHAVGPGFSGPGG